MRAPVLGILLVLLLLAGGLYLALSGPQHGPDAVPAASGASTAAQQPGPAALTDAAGGNTPAGRSADRSGVLLLRALLPGGRPAPSARFLLAQGDAVEWRDAPDNALALPRDGGWRGAAAYSDGLWSAPARFRDEELHSAPEHVFELTLPAARLSVQVLRPDGSAATDYALDLRYAGELSKSPTEWEDLGRLYARAQTMDQAALDDVPPGIWTVSVRSGRDAPQSQSVRLEAGASASLEFLLSPGCFVHGRVADADGAAIAGARLRLIPGDLGMLESFLGDRLASGSVDWLEELAAPGGEASSDPQGAFRAGPLAPGTFRIVASAPGYLSLLAPARLELAPGTDSEAPVLVLRRGVALAVQVLATETGQPLADATVRYSPGVRDSSPLGAALPWLPEDPPHTGADGLARLEGLAPGPLSLQVAASGRGTRELVVPVPETGGGDPVRVSLDAALAIHGQVLDAGTLQPVAGARVRAQRAGGNSFMEQLLPVGQGEPSAASSEDGRFRADGLTAGSYQVRVEADGYAPALAGPVDLDAAHPESELEVRLLHGGSLRVLSLDEDGAPRAKVVVSVFSFNAGPPAGMQTGSDGIALFEHLPAGDYTVSASSFDTEGQALAVLGGDLSGLETHMDQAKIEEGQVTELTLGGPVQRSTVSGTVTCGGEPQVGLAVLLVSGGSFQAGRTDEDGHYEIEDVPAGEYVFMAGEMQIGGGAGYTAAVTVPGGAPVQYDVALPGGGMKVRVTDRRDGQPVSGVYVIVRPQSGPMDMDMLNTDSAGEAHFRFLDPGDYYVSAGRGVMGFSFGNGGGDRSSSVVGPVHVDAGETSVDVNLDAPARIRARVLDRAGEPVPGAGLFYYDRNGQPLSLFSITVTGNDGWLELGSLPPGPGTLQARHPQMGVSEKPVELRAGETTEVELRLESGTLVHVTPVDDHGAPVRGVQAMVLDAAGAPVPVVFSGAEAMSSWTNYLSGREQRLGPLRAGHYTLLLVRPGGATVSQPLDVAAGVADMTLRPVFAP